MTRLTNREHLRNLKQLADHNVITTGDLLARLPGLPLDLQEFSMWLISIFQIHEACNALFNLLDKEDLRQQCAAALGILKPNQRIVSKMVSIARRELSANAPCSSWLSAVIHGLCRSSKLDSVDVLVSIFERQDLPGWLRGNAADKLGFSGVVQDRRTRNHRRCRDAAIRGLSEKSIEVQFWSMYLLGALAVNSSRSDRTADALTVALPSLRRIASRDHRLAPGYWWPMSAEAKDVMHAIKHGYRQMPEAAERWLGNSRRGSRDL